MRFIPLFSCQGRHHPDQFVGRNSHPYTEMVGQTTAWKPGQAAQPAAQPATQNPSDKAAPPHPSHMVAEAARCHQRATSERPSSSGGTSGAGWASRYSATSSTAGPGPGLGGRWSARSATRARRRTAAGAAQAQRVGLRRDTQRAVEGGGGTGGEARPPKEA